MYICNAWNMASGRFSFRRSLHPPLTRQGPKRVDAPLRLLRTRPIRLAHSSPQGLTRCIASSPIPASPCSPTFPFFLVAPCIAASIHRRAHPPCSLVIPPTCLSSHGQPCEVPHLTLWLQGLDCYYPQLLSLPPCAALGAQIHTLLFKGPFGRAVLPDSLVK
jgi:hypothetical protein